MKKLSDCLCVSCNYVMNFGGCSKFIFAHAQTAQTKALRARGLWKEEGKHRYLLGFLHAAFGPAKMSSISAAQVRQLKQFITLCKAKPDVLHLPELSFLKDWLIR